MATEGERPRARGATLGYGIVLLGAALFVASCFLPYYGFGEGSFSLYDQLSVPQEGGLALGTILLLFGGVATVVVVAIVGLTRSERRPSGRALLAGAVAAWSLTWIGSLLQTANLREEILPEGLSLVGGFWLQAVSIGVAIIGTILVAARRAGAHERHGVPSDPDAARRA